MLRHGVKGVPEAVETTTSVPEVRITVAEEGDKDNKQVKDVPGVAEKGLKPMGRQVHQHLQHEEGSEAARTGFWGWGIGARGGVWVVRV